MVVGGRHLGDEALTRGRRSRAASPSAPPNGVLTPAGGQNVVVNAGGPKADSKADKNEQLKNDELLDEVERCVSPAAHHHAPPIDPDLRTNGDIMGSPSGASGHSHHSSHHLLPNPMHHHHHHSQDSDSDAESDSGMRIGDEYQAVIPEFKPESNPESNHGAMLIWAPKPDLNEQKLDEYVALAKDKYGYNTEQALGMLFWHKYNVDRATTDLANFTPYPDDWSVEDKVLFEQAFSFHGKSFHRIRQMLPDKSIASLVKYYYSWKKTRYRTSVMDRQARKLQAGAVEEPVNGVDENANSGSKDLGEVMDFIDESDESSGSSEAKGQCVNCAAATSHLSSTSGGSQLCATCFSFWRRTGVMRSTIGPTRRPAHGHGSAHRDDSVLFNKGAAKTNPPKDMNLQQEDLDVFTLGPPPIVASNASSVSSASPNSAEAPNSQNLNPNSSQVFSGSYGSDGILKSLESDVITLKRQVQSNKQLISQHKHKMCGPSAVAVASETLQTTGLVEGVDTLLSASASTEATFAALSRITMRWSNEELLLAVQGVREYGQDFRAIAEVLGTKSESQVRSFYNNYKRRYHLDDVYAEYLQARRDQAEGKSPKRERDEDDDEEPMEVDEVKIVETKAPSATPSEVDVKEESNSSDSFISAADAVELNEKLASKEDQRAARARKSASPAEASGVKGAAVVVVGDGKAPSKASSSPLPPPSPEPAAPDTPDSSSEATPIRRSTPAATGTSSARKGPELSVPDVAATASASKSASPNPSKPSAKPDAVGPARPTRTSVAKTVLTSS